MQKLLAKLRFAAPYLLRTSAIVSLIELTGIGIAMVTVSAQPSASAASDSADVEVRLEFDVKPYLRFSPSSESVNIQLTTSNLANEEFVSNTQDLTLGTNNKTGYTLMLTTATDNTALVNSTHTIPSITTTTSSANFDANKWGIKKNDETNFSPVRGKTYAGDTTISATDEAGPGSTSVTVGTKANATLASGSYTNTLLYTMVANFIPTPTYTISYSCNGGTGSVASQAKTEDIDITLSDGSTCSKSGSNLISWNAKADGTGTSYELGSTYSANADIALFAIWESATPIMQSFTSAQCSAMSTNATMTLKDARDDNEYTIVKLGSPINICWMQQNLRLGKSSAMTLTPNDTDITKNYTLPAVQTSGTTDWSSDTTGRVYATGDASYANYYSWYAATAGTGTPSMSSSEAPSSICPKGWRLPTSDEFKTLNSTYNSGSNSSDSGLIADPLKLVRAGDYYSGDGTQGTYGAYWSSTAYSSDSSRACYMFFRSGGVIAASNSSKFLGASVRCVSSN